MEQTDLNLIQVAQREMRQQYLNGATGMIISGIVWLLSGILAYGFALQQAVWTLLIGGVFIYPVSLLLTKLLGASGSHSRQNALGKLAMEGTFFMLMCIPVAYLLSLQRVEWFFEAMLLIIGGRYLSFQTIYGNRLFWILGAALGIAAYLLFVIHAKPFAAAFSGAGIELIFGLYVLVISKNK